MFYVIDAYAKATRKARQSPPRVSETTPVDDGESMVSQWQRVLLQSVATSSGNEAKDQTYHTTNIEELLQNEYEEGSPRHIWQQFARARYNYPPSPTTAEILEEAICVHDKIPADSLTRQHFGYSKVDSVEEESCLQGLYKGLFLFPRPPHRREIQEWVQQDKLAEGIERYYSGARSGYFNWFKKNKHVFSQSYERAEGPWAPIEKYFEVDMKKLNELAKSDTESEEEDE